MAGESDEFDLSIISAFTDTEFNYEAARLGVELRLPLPRRNHLFLRGGANFYEYDVKDDGDTVFSEDGTKPWFQAGWRMQFASGLGITAMYEYQEFDPDVELETVAFGIRYSF